MGEVAEDIHNQLVEILGNRLVKALEHVWKRLQEIVRLPPQWISYLLFIEYQILRNEIEQYLSVFKWKQ